MLTFLSKPIIFDFKSNAFDFLRLLLAILVVVYHSTFYFAGAGKPSWIFYPISGWQYTETHLGEFAVHGFFVISGFLITASMLRSATIQEFFWKRIVRLYPGFLVAIFSTAFVFAPTIGLLSGKLAFGNITGWASYLMEACRYFFRNLFLETTVVEIPTVHPWDINGSLWTLMIDLKTYILTAVLFAFGILNKRNVILVGAIGLNILYFVLTKFVDLRNQFDIVFYDFRFLALIMYFVVGMTFYLFMDTIVWSWKYFVLAIFALILGFWFNLAGLFFPISIGYLVLFLSQILPIKSLSKKIGDYSYGVYIYSSPIQLVLQYMIAAGLFSVSFLWFNVLSIVISLFVGFLSWNLVEKNFLKR